LLRDFEQARRMHKARWADGSYTRVAAQLTGVSAAVVEAAAIRDSTSAITRASGPERSELAMMPGPGAFLPGLEDAEPAGGDRGASAANTGSKPVSMV
jgi:hypothetical protein